VETIPHVHNRYGDRAAEILGISLISKSGEAVIETIAGEKLSLLITAIFREDVTCPIVGFTIRDKVGVEVTASNTSYEGVALPPANNGDTITVAFEFEVPELRPDSYSISPAVAQGNVWEHTIEDWIDNAYIFTLLDTGLVYGSMKWAVDVRFKKGVRSS
jgi:hypothetical protein